MQRAGVERGGHDHELEVGPARLLEVEGAGEGDVAIEMPLVEFVEDNDGDAAQLRVAQHLPQQHAFGDKADARLPAAHFVEPDLVTHFLAQPHPALLRHPRREHSRGEPARLEDHDLAVTRQPAVQQDLRNLGGLARAGRCLEHEARVGAQVRDELGFEFVDRQGGHRWGMTNDGCRMTRK